MLRRLSSHMSLPAPLVRFLLFITICSLLALSSTASTKAAADAVNWPLIRLQLVTSGLSNPIDLVDPNDGTNRLFVIERGGTIRIIENGQLLDEPFLDIRSEVFSSNEGGLLGLAFPPDFAESGYFIVNYTNKANLIDPDPDDDDNNNDQRVGDTVIARFRVSDNPNIADAGSEERLLLVHQPASNHNGGHILFGPDGYLYIGMGDGGGGGDPYNNAQDPKSLHGKLLRIQVGATGPYTIPEDNPFVDDPDYRDEIWAVGLRNPWRFSFDRLTGDLYVADVGQNALEEVNHIPASEIGNGGMNFGWPIMEADICYPPGNEDCNREGLVMPAVAYTHDAGNCSVTGGYVYRSNLPNQAPVYLYGDFCTGQVWGMQQDDGAWVTQLLTNANFRLTSFGEDRHGNVYLVNFAGEIYRIAGPALSHYVPNLVKNVVPVENE